MGTTGLRNGAIVAFVVSMAILLVGGHFANRQAPPIPQRVTSGENRLTDRETILRGQDVYQRYGLMDHGSVWGHGSLPRHGLLGRHPAPHRQAITMLHGRGENAQPASQRRA